VSGGRSVSRPWREPPGGEPLWVVPEILTIFCLVRRSPNLVLNGRLPEATARVLSPHRTAGILPIRSKRQKPNPCRNVTGSRPFFAPLSGFSREPKFSDILGHGPKRLPSRTHPRESANLCLRRGWTLKPLFTFNRCSACRNLPPPRKTCPNDR
jgi:hypothetical protein